MIDDAAARELKLYIDNDGDLYRRQTTAILKNLATKKARGIYKHDLAVKLFGHLVEAGARKYADEFEPNRRVWHQMFDAKTRRAVAEALTKDFEGEYALGNYDSLLPKKYQKEMQQHFKKKASPTKYISAMPDFPKLPPGTILAERGEKTKKSTGHARKKIAWRVPEGLAVAWAPANQAYFALWPAGEDLRKQQVLHVGDADEMDAWLRERYGHEYGRRRGSSHARVKGAPKFKAGDIVKRTAARMRSMGLVGGPINGMVVGYSGVWPLIRWSDMSETEEPMAQAEEGLELDKRAMARRGHARMAPAMHEAMHEASVLRGATDRQLRSFYRDEKQDVARARAEGRRRGLDLHATKKSASQLDREIAQHVPSWRGGR